MTSPRRIVTGRSHGWLALSAAVALLGCQRDGAPPRTTTRCTLLEETVRCGPDDEAVPSAQLEGYTVRITGTVTATAVPSHGGFACAIADGAVFCWGIGDQGQLGDGVHAATPRGPVQVAGVAGAVALSAVPWSACALDRRGDVICWGALHAIEVRTETREPHPTTIVTGATDLAATWVQTCAVTAAGAVCWGGEYPDAEQRQRHTVGPTVVPDTAGAATLRGAGAAMCARWPDGRERCWSITPLPLAPDP